MARSKKRDHKIPGTIKMKSSRIWVLTPSSSTSTSVRILTRATFNKWPSNKWVTLCRRTAASVTSLMTIMSWLGYGTRLPRARITLTKQVSSHQQIDMGHVYQTSSSQTVRLQFQLGKLFSSDRKLSLGKPRQFARKPQSTTRLKLEV